MSFFKGEKKLSTSFRAKCTYFWVDFAQKVKFWAKCMLFGVDFAQKIWNYTFFIIFLLLIKIFLV